MPTLDFFSTYHLAAVVEEIVPTASFFRDRYFPTGAEDIFAADEVLTEYRKGSRRLPAFIGSGDMVLDRKGYSIHSYQPARIALSRFLTLDELQKRGFGEAIYANSTQAERAVRLQMRDLAEMDAAIARREEWMAVQTMMHNACTMQEFFDANTSGDKLHVQFYDDASDHTYTVASKWDSDDGDFFADIKAMCKQLAKRGLPATDLVLGSQAADAICDIPKVRELLDNRRMEYGTLAPKLTDYPSVAFLGTLNFGGHVLSLFEVAESYEDANGVDTPYFPPTAAMVTAPSCGHMMYGQVTQIDYGMTDYTTHVASRVPKFTLDQVNDQRALRLTARPLAAPVQYCPYLFAADVV